MSGWPLCATSLIYLDGGELVHGSLCGFGGDARVDDGREESHSAHDRVASFAERDRLVRQWTQDAA